MALEAKAAELFNLADGYSTKQMAIQPSNWLCDISVTQ